MGNTEKAVKTLYRCPDCERDFHFSRKNRVRCVFCKSLNLERLGPDHRWIKADMVDPQDYRFALTFSIYMFKPGTREQLLKYFRGTQIAQETAENLGINRGTWDRMMANIMTVALSTCDDDAPFAMIEELKPNNG